jgi:phosphopantetheinyl transferase (holo-ACP synthase)
MPQTDLRPAPESPGSRNSGNGEGAGEGPGATLLGVGIDAERVERFEKLAADGRFRRHVCSRREAEHLASQPQPALAFCASFCCKEALCKGLGEAYAFPECECLFRPGATELEIVLSPGLRHRHGLAGVRARLHERYLGERGECVVEAHLFREAVHGDDVARQPREGSATAGPARARLATLSVAAAEAGRRRIEQRHFSPAELGDLGNRRVQSLAGALALKRALVALWAAAGCDAAVEPREFELSHHDSGAPRLVAAPRGLALADVLVSISHTRGWAYGLAASRRRAPAVHAAGTAGDREPGHRSRPGAKA